MATKKSTKKAAPKITEAEVKNEVKSKTVRALFRFAYKGKIYQRGEEIELDIESAKDLTERKFTEYV